MYSKQPLRFKDGEKTAYQTRVLATLKWSTLGNQTPHGQLKNYKQT